MDIKELKRLVETNNTPEFMIWNVPNDQSRIIAIQYINRICKDKNLQVKNIESYLDIPDQSFVEDNNLYIYDDPDVIKSYPNLIIICKNNKSKAKEAVNFPTLTNWEVSDYISSMCKGINKDTIDKYVSLSRGNYSKVISDFERISIFNHESQQVMFNLLESDNQFNGYSDKKIFDLSNAIIRRDRKSLLSLLENIDEIDVNPMALISLLYNGFKSVICVQTSQSQPSWLDSKQYYVVKKFNCGHYSNDELREIFNLITDIEYKFKYQSLSLHEVIDYLIINILKEN